MNSTTFTVLHAFFLALGFGTQIFSPLVNTRLTGVGFFKLCISVVLGSLLLALITDYLMDQQLVMVELTLYIGLILLNLLSYIFHKDEKSALMWAIYAFQVLGFSAAIFYFFNFNSHWIIFFATSMLLLGMSNFAMLLGHYYLVVPKLTEEPLIYCLNILWVVLFIKIITSLAVIFSAGIPYLTEGSVLGDGYMYNWLFISMRYAWGYLAPLVLSFFTYKLCRMRSIQSATGVLYIILFFVIVGELISIYLMAKHGLAL